MDRDERELAPVLKWVRVIGSVIAFLPITLSVWIFHYSRVMLQSDKVEEGASAMEIVEPLKDSWIYYRNIGNFILALTVLILLLLLLIAKLNRNRNMREIASILFVDIVISAVLLTFSYAIGAFLTSVYLLLLNITGG